MKYRLLKSLPGIEVGTIIDTSKDAQTYSERKMWEFIASFGSDNDFFEPIKESKYWGPKKGEIISNVLGESFPYVNSEIYNRLLSAGLAFKTKEEAEKQLKLMQAITRCKKYLVENDMLLSDEELRDLPIDKYYINWGKDLDGSGLDWYASNNFYYPPYGYINSDSNAEWFIQDCQEDLLLIHKPC